ncbi:MAG: bifunctional serine/threonine-protein kinase/formylglycine-generating enzyme family protein [Planctomycetota bacterium]|jgi:serine/threonine-protein kinase
MPDENAQEAADSADSGEREQADRDREFAELALKQGFVTQPQIEDAVKAQATILNLGLKRSLSEILVEKGLLTGIQAETVNRTVDAGGDIKMVAGYELMEKLGEGGMGVVYKARQLSLDRVVALKILPEKMGRDREFAGRFMREARLAARLDHVNIVRALDVGEAQGVRYFAMELVEGEDVGSVLDREGKMAEARAIDIIIQAARALDHAHSHQLIHRDIKPDNILLTEGGIAKVADLGLARSTDEHTTRMTVTGTAMGTPHYISPEQARGEADIDIRTDIYSLGVTFYHMASGTPPFQGSSAAIVITRRLTEEPPSVRDVAPEVSEGTAQVVRKMMARERENRYANPAELLRDLELVADGKKPTLVSEGAPAPTAGPLTLAGVHKPKFPPLDGGGSRRLLWAGVAGAGVVAVVLVALVVALAVRSGNGAPRGGRPGVDVAASVRNALDEIDALAKKGDFQGAIEAARTGKSSYEGTEHAAVFAARLDELSRALMKTERGAAAKARLELVRLLRESGKIEEALGKARDGVRKFAGAASGPEIAKELEELEALVRAAGKVATKLEAIKALEDAGSLDEAVALALESARELEGSCDVTALLEAGTRIEAKIRGVAGERHANAAAEELARLRGIAAGANLEGAKLDDAFAAAEAAAKKYSSTASAKALADLAAALGKSVAERKRSAVVAAEELARLRAMAADAGKLEGAKLDDARGAARAAAEKYSSTPSAKALSDLAADLGKRIAERERIAGQDRDAAARKADAARRLLARARELYAGKQFEKAAVVYAEVVKLQPSEEARKGVADSRFAMYVAAADEKEKAGDTEGAIDRIRKALGVRSDAGLRRRLAALELAKGVEVALAKARGLKANGDLAAAREAYANALAAAPEDRRAAIRAEIDAIDAAIAYGEAMATARGAASAKRWADAERAARKARAAKPGDSEAQKLLDAAKAALALAARKPDTGTKEPGTGESGTDVGKPPTPAGLPRQVTNSLGMELVLVPAGVYRIGDTAGDADERPVRQVTLGSFYIGRAEVTNAQYEKFDRRHRRSADYSPGKDHPVVSVSWNDAARFAKWLSKRERANYRLPTEAEWEAAARGTDSRPFPWGSDRADAGGAFRANWGEGKDRSRWSRDGFAAASPAGSFPKGASPFGCLDMAGNVWEWCADWYAADAYAKSRATDPTGPARGSEKVLRGGSFANDIAIARSANRHRADPKVANPIIGFRLVLVAPKAK